MVSIAWLIRLHLSASSYALIRFVRKRAGYAGAEISYAEKHNNQRRIEGLNKALQRSTRQLY